MRHAGVVVLLAAALVGCGSEEPAGNDAVYDRINSTEDCATLQAEFDTADSNGKTDYMKAADERMREVGCY